MQHASALERRLRMRRLMNRNDQRGELLGEERKQIAPTSGVFHATLNDLPRVSKHDAFSALSLYRIPHSDFICVLSFGTVNSLDFHSTPRSAGKLNIPHFPADVLKCITSLLSFIHLIDKVLPLLAICDVTDVGCVYAMHLCTLQSYEYVFFICPFPFSSLRHGTPAPLLAAAICHFRRQCLLPRLPPPLRIIWTEEEDH